MLGPLPSLCMFIVCLLTNVCELYLQGYLNTILVYKNCSNLTEGGCIVHLYHLFHVHCEEKFKLSCYVALSAESCYCMYCIDAGYLSKRSAVAWLLAQHQQPISPV